MKENQLAKKHTQDYNKHVVLKQNKNKNGSAGKKRINNQSVLVKTHPTLVGKRHLEVVDERVVLSFSWCGCNDPVKVSNIAIM